MRYDKFSTKNADYVARYGLHRKNSNSPECIFDGVGGGVDGVVLEIRGSKIWTAGSIRKAFRKILKGTAQREDYNIVEYCKDRKIPIYITGHEMSKRSYVIFWAIMVIMLLLIRITWPIIFLFFFVVLYIFFGKKEKVAVLVSFFMAVNSMFDQSMGGVGVDALCAKKMEEYVVPRLRKKLGRRPRIGLNYGAAHVGLRFYFKSKRLRNFNLFTLEYMNYEFWQKWGAYRGKVGRVYKADFDEGIGKWKVRALETHFFDE